MLCWAGTVKSWLLSIAGGGDLVETTLNRYTP